MKQTSDLITTSRLISRNALNADGTYAISDAEILQYLNDGQDRMQNLISATKNIAKIFVRQLEIDVVGQQEDYAITDRVLLNKQIEYVEFSADGSSQNYVRLEKLNYFNRDPYYTTYPYGYIKTGGKIKLCPVPSVTGGTIRVTYEGELDDLALRCGTVTSATTTEIDITDVVVAALPATNDYICVVSPDGARLAKNIPITLYMGGTVSTADITTYLEDGVSVSDLVGGYVTVGRYTSAVTQLPSNCERYLVHYAASELFHRDSSNDYDKEVALLGEIEKDIVKSMASQTGEIQFTPQMGRFDWW